MSGWELIVYGMILVIVVAITFFTIQSQKDEIRAALEKKEQRTL